MRGRGVLRAQQRLLTNAQQQRRSVVAADICAVDLVQVYSDPARMHLGASNVWTLSAW